MSTILLIEDNEMNRDMLSRRLIRAGYSVSTAATAIAGLTIARISKPQVILMDLRLPDISGFDATRELKADPITSNIPVIALTAHAMEGDEQKALAAGCDDYDTKPVDMPRLLDKISRLSQRAFPQTDAASTNSRPAPHP